MNRFLLVLLALVIAGALGAAFYRQHRAHRQLAAQLQQLTDELMGDNEDADQVANRAVQGLHAAVARNQNQPRELALLAAAENLDQRADSLVHTLRQRREELLLATRNLTSQPTLPHPAETRAVARLLGPGSAAHRNLMQQLAAYAAARHALSPTPNGSVSAPAFEGLPVVAALAALAQLETDVRAAETSGLHNLASRVGTSRLTPSLVALASAESNLVAPGETYRARLLLTNALKLPTSAEMRCNGQLIPIDSSGLGRVRFVAAARPGPATWTGTIHFQVAGRDTTFQLRVPYRVVRR